MSGGTMVMGAAPPPPGIIPNFDNPPDHSKQVIIEHTICLTLGTLAVAVRLFTRAAVTRNVGWDDWTCLFAWAMVVSFSGVLLASLQYGFGRHLWDVRAEWLIPELKLALVDEILYLPIALAIKTAFLLFYDRIFGVKIRKWVIAGIVANALFYTAFFFETIFLCNPVAKAYNPLLPGKCLDDRHIGPIFSGVWAFLTDFYILILPIYCVWNLQAKRDRKLKLTIVFGVGLFACIASICRFAYTFQAVDSEDILWTYATLSFWSVLEIYAGLICCCLPAFLPFFEYSFPKGFSLGSYFSRISSFFSRSRVSTGDSSNKTPSGQSKAIVVNSDVDVQGEYVPLKEGKARVAAYRSDLESGHAGFSSSDSIPGKEVRSSEFPIQYP